MSEELSQLKQEVAALWTRYRKEEPASAVDENRRQLADLNLTLESKRRVLADRSHALRLELEAQRRRASRLSPVVQVVGGFFGAVMAAVLVASGLPELAELSVALTTGHGLTLLGVSLLVVGLSVSKGC